MADKNARLKALGRSASTESTEYSITMGKSLRRKSKKAKPKERWLLTRKTWRYMTDAGKKLIPDGAQNRPEDIPKIEAYFQEVCKKEPRFLLWRKNSYPGAIGFRKKRKNSRIGGSCRKTSSADEASTGRSDKPQRPTHLAIEPTTIGKFDLKRMKEEFFSEKSTPEGFSSYDLKATHPDGEPHGHSEEIQLVSMLEKYLTLGKSDPKVVKSNADFNYQDLVDKLQRHLHLCGKDYGADYTRYVPPQHVHFEGDNVQKSLLETISRYYGQSSNRDKIVSDLLTNRKALEKLYFELRKAKGFRGSRGGTGYTTSYAYGPQRSNYESGKQFHKGSPTANNPPPLIEVQAETVAEVSHHNWATQTLPVPESVLHKAEEEYKKLLEERNGEEAVPKEGKTTRRRSSVDHDDVSQSVSDTIKRYLRMARKKSVDVEKSKQGFKSVNYDRNLRNIKPKGEITKPGDDDGLHKGCQTNENWALTYRDLKFADMYDVSDVESRFSSSRSSIDAGPADAASPPSVKGGHSFLSHLLHGKHDKKHSSSSSASAVSGSGVMQKSKSSSSVMHHGSRLMAKKIFRSRSKSQTRPAHAPCNWTPQGSCIWNNIIGRQVILSDTSLLHLSDVERKVLQKVAIAKLQALNLGVNIKVPSESSGCTVAKPKRRPYLLKRKALTTGIFDTSRKDAEKDKDGNPPSAGLVFGIPLTQCVENDRLNRAALASSPFRSRADLPGGGEEPNMGRHGSRSSFCSLIDTPRNEEKGSSDNLLLLNRMVGSVPGLLDTISCSSKTDIPASVQDEESAVPNILTECFRHLEQYGLHTLGIFRVSTSKKRIRQLREDFDCGKETTLEEEQSPHDVATLLKEYLRDLPDPLLCRDLYQAFVQTQRIRNRRLQFEALQHLVQLLPPVNRDTLHALMSFLSLIARNANDAKDETGEDILGNKMDSTNLATVFAPNILHCIKPGAKDGADKPEDRLDVINVVRSLIDHYKTIYTIPAELLDEVYLHMMDSHPEALDQILNKRDGTLAAEESVDELDSESSSAPWTPTAPPTDPPLDSIFDVRPSPATEQKKTYSREEFLHEAAATGGPNMGMRIRHKDRIRERSTRRRREREKEDGGLASALTIISRLKGQKDEDYNYAKNRSSSLESTSSTHTDCDLARVARTNDDGYERRKSSPYVLDNTGVITASLTIPVHAQNQALSYNIDEDIPYIEDGETCRQQLTVGLVRTPTAPPRRRNHSVGSDSSATSTAQAITGSIYVVPGYDSAVGSSATYSSPVQNTPTSLSGSIVDAGVYSSPPSWTSSPPTSPDSTRTSVNYIPDEVGVSRTTMKSVSRSAAKETAAGVQKVSFSSTQELQQIKESEDPSVGYQRQVSFTKQKVASSEVKAVPEAPKPAEREPRYTPSITSIGNAVLRSRTADFEKIIKVDSGKAKASPVASTVEREKKKYTKRRYTDSRHQTRHIPDAETLESASAQDKREEKNNNSSQSGPVYKRRELISSVPSK